MTTNLVKKGVGNVENDLLSSIQTILFGIHPEAAVKRVSSTAVKELKDIPSDIVTVVQDDGMEVDGVPFSRVIHSPNSFPIPDNIKRIKSIRWSFY